MKNHIVTEEIISNLQKKGSHTIPLLGMFKIVQIKGRRRFDLKKKKVIAQPTYNKVTFVASDGLKEIFNK